MLEMRNFRARAVPLFQKVRDEVQVKAVDFGLTAQTSPSAPVSPTTSRRQRSPSAPTPENDCSVRTATEVLVALSTDRALTDARYTRNVIKSYVQTKLQHGRSKEEVSFKLADIERAVWGAMRERNPGRLAQVATAFVSVRSEFRLKPSTVLARVIRSAQRRALIEAEAAAEAEQVQATEVLPPPPYTLTPPLYACALPAPVEYEPPVYEREEGVREEAVGRPAKAPRLGAN
ncbi:hypothetical protein Q8F55_008305 [Vanrija albida]|uniref:Uncharacterized protein n=1 Tax=Vanrija albida TaxID=181172 RepID=A0ABR3PVZ0_9TREE